MSNLTQKSNRSRKNSDKDGKDLIEINGYGKTM